MSEHDDKLQIRKLERTIVWLVGLLQQAWEALDEDEDDAPFTSELCLAAHSKPRRWHMADDLAVVITDPPGLAIYQEFNAAGSPVPPKASIAYLSDNPSVATVDPVTGQLAYVSAGVANISGSDGGNLSASAALTVNPATGGGDTTPVSSTMTLKPGSPIATAVKKL